VGDIAQLSFSRTKANEEITLEDAIMHRSRLLTWYEGLPRPLTPYYIVLPAQLGIQYADPPEKSYRRMQTELNTLHSMYYHNVLISIFSPFAAEVDGNTAASPAQPPTPSPGQIIAQSKASIKALLPLYYCKQHASTLGLTATKLFQRFL